MTKSILLAGAALAVAMIARPAFADPVKVVAAENFYGDVATQVGGGNVAVTSILSNPDDDPHLFEASASTAKALADAKVVIVSGIDYDPWMEKLLSANKSAGRREILVAALAHKKIADMRKKYAGQPVTASEPVFGYMAELLGLKVHNEKFALAVMNNTEPSASDVAAFENDLKGHKVKVMLYNAQASEPAVQRLVDIAKDNKIPVVGVSETEPSDSTYQSWMTGQLDALDKALGGATN